jgi:F-type H+-transporting ATPase subunit epsilon
VKTFLLEIRTPEKLFLSERAESLVAPAEEGKLGVLPGHIRGIVRLKPGKVHFHARKSSRFLIISEGYMNIFPDRVSIFVESVQPWVEIPQSSVSMKTGHVHG